MKHNLFYPRDSRVYRTVITIEIRLTYITQEIIGQPGLMRPSFETTNNYSGIWFLPRKNDKHLFYSFDLSIAYSLLGSLAA
jgi:hypothetical protein